MNLLDYGFKPELYPEIRDNEGIFARVTAVHRERYELFCDLGICYGRLKTASYYGRGEEEFPTTGDFVLIQYNPGGDSPILRTLPRQSKFVRNDFSGHAANYVKTVLSQVVAANFDYVMIMASLNHDLNVNRIERYLTLSWQSGATPVIILTKADLVEDCSEQVREVEKAAMGVAVIAVSAHTGYGLTELDPYMKPGKTLVFLGSSGIGKSSLVNALAGEDIMAVNTIREDDSKGRHTTTHRQMILLKNGTMIIDTPGMRELGLWDADAGIEETFSDVEQYFGSCKFSNCSHQSEPGCAVKDALDSGELDASRWESYLSLKRESRFVDDKAGYLRSKEQWGKNIAIMNKQKEKGRKRNGY